MKNGKESSGPPSLFTTAPELCRRPPANKQTRCLTSTETIRFIRDGEKGEKGEKGVKGEKGGEGGEGGEGGRGRGRRE